MSGRGGGGGERRRGPRGPPGGRPSAIRRWERGCRERRRIGSRGVGSPHAGSSRSRVKCSYARWSVRNVRRYGERAERDDTASVWRDHHHRAPSPSARRCASSRRRPTRTLETRRTHGSFRNLGPCVVGLAARLDPLQTRPHRLFPTQRYASDDDDDARARRRRPRLCWRSV